MEYQHRERTRGLALKPFSPFLSEKDERAGGLNALLSPLRSKYLARSGYDSHEEEAS